MGDWRREQYLLRTRLSSYRQRLEEARNIIRAALRLVSRPMVAFSCGKDSSVLAHLVLEQAPGTPLRFLSSGETRILHDVDTVIDWFRSQGAVVEEINIDRVFSPEWQHAGFDEQRKAGVGDLDLINEGGYDGVFMGLRAEESRQRRLSLYGQQTEGLPPFCYRYRSGKRQDMIRICPLARWQTNDVGAYLAAHDIPFLQQYHRHGMDARTTARLTGTAVRMGALAEIKRHNPQGWRRLIARFPELRGMA